MEELIDIIQKENQQKTLTLKEHEQNLKNVGMIWKKPHEFNPPVAGKVTFDDFFKLEGYCRAKISKFIVGYQETPDKPGLWLQYLQFFYKTLDGRIIEGYEQVHFEAPGMNEQKVQIFQLDDDEYAIKMIGKSESYFKTFGFETTKGRRLIFGIQSTDLPEQEVSAPQGLHFTNIGSMQCFEGIYSIVAESTPIPMKNQKNDKQCIDFHKLGGATKYIIQFLGIKDIFSLFRTNKYFSSWRYSPIYLNRLLKRIIYTCNIQTREYIEQILKRVNQNSRSIQKIKKLLEITQNKIKNPFGENGFEGFKQTQTGGDGWKIINNCPQNYRRTSFISSYDNCQLLFYAQLSDLFDQEFLTLLNEGNACLVGGCYMRDFNFGSSGYVFMIVRDENTDQELARLSVEEPQLQKEWKQFFLKYEKNQSHKNFQPTTVYLFVGGKDKRFWKGHFGNVISGITLRGLPFYSRKDRALVDF